MNREQGRAMAAHRHVTAIVCRSEAERKRYATVIYQTIPLVRNAGLVQALEFLHALSNQEKREAAAEFVDQLAEQLKAMVAEIQDGESLRRYAREQTDLQKYLLLTREIMAALVWYRRFVQSILKIEPTNDEDDA